MYAAGLFEHKYLESFFRICYDSYQNLNEINRNTLKQRRKFFWKKQTSVGQNPLGTAPVGSLIGKFAIPAIISMLVSAMYNIVDQIFIGQGVGMLGNAATNVAFPVTTIATALALLLGIEVRLTL